MKKLILCLLLLPLYFQSGAQCVSSIVLNTGTCGAGCNAVVAIQFSGGILPLTLTLSDGTNQLGPFTATSFWQFGSLCPGNYTLTVIDANGDTCGGVTNFPILLLPTPDVQVISSNATCTACSDGSATITGITGGSAPYNYLWSNGSTGQSITGLLPGIYTINATDANGCTDVDTILIGIGNSSFYTVSGQVYFDSNSNGIKDLGETGIGNIGVDLTPGSITALTNLQGYYGFVTDTGTYDITYPGAPGWNLTSSPGTYNVNVSNASVGNLDFGLYPDSTLGSAVASIYGGWPRCFWNVPYYLTVHNNGFTILNGAMTFTHDPLMTYVSSSVAPFSYSGNVLTYTYSNLAPGQSLTIVVTLTEPAGGTSILNSLSVTGTDAFGYQFAQTANYPQVVTCSYDPNDKAVQPAGQGTSNFVTMDTWLDYMVRFQNTGTDTAFTVVVIDTIDANLDMNSFTFTGSSHPVDITIKQGNEITFTFNNILLADSNTNEPASHGYLLYRIKGNASNPDPTVINNTAYIYFDLNAPVVTNTTLTTYSDNFLAVADVSNEDNLFELFPNPMENTAMLRIKNRSDINYTVTMRDLQGRTVNAPQKLENGILLIKKDQLVTGTYILEAVPNNNTEASYLRLIIK